MGESATEARRDWAALYRDRETAEHYDRRFAGTKSWNNRWIWRAVARMLRKAGGGRWPAEVIDAPAGTGRFTAELRAAGVTPVHLDRSPAMLRRLRDKHGRGREVIGDLVRPPLAEQADGVVLCLRFLQHLNRAERIEALRGMTRLAPRAVVAYYPGWHYKNAIRHLRHRLGLPHRTLRERIRRAAILDEVREGGWRILELNQVLPLLSENVLLLLERAE